MLEFQENLCEEIKENVHLTFSFDWCLEVMKQNVSKGNAITKLSKFLQIPVTRSIGFGDGMNDIEMLSTVNKAIVMENAPEEVKQTLCHAEVIGNCIDESVAKYLANLI